MHKQGPASVVCSLPHLLENMPAVLLTFVISLLLMSLPVRPGTISLCNPSFNVYSQNSGG